MDYLCDVFGFVMQIVFVADFYKFYLLVDQSIDLFIHSFIHTSLQRV